MGKSIVVKYRLYDREDTVSVPIFYEIEQEENTETYHCKVNLAENEMPEWLTLKEFSIPTVYEPGSPGVTITSFSEVKGIKNIDTALFVGKVYNQIWVAERWLARHF